MAFVLSCLACATLNFNLSTFSLSLCDLSLNMPALYRRADLCRNIPVPAGVPSVALSSTPYSYYAQYPALALAQQSLATLFPYLENLRDHLIRIDPASPFSGAAMGPTPTARTSYQGRRQAKGRRNNRAARNGTQKGSSTRPPAPTPHPILVLGMLN